MPKKIVADIFSLFSSSFVGQVIHITALPFLSAAFSQTQIGAFFLFQALVAVGAIFISLQSEQAIVVESNVGSYTCFKKSLLIVSLLSLLVFVVSGGVEHVWELFAQKSTVSQWIGYLPLALFFAGSNNALEYLFTHEKRFRLISVLRIVRPLSIYGAIFGFHFFTKYTENNLIAGFLAGSGLMLLLQVFVLIPNRLCWFNKHDFLWSEFKAYFQKHKNILVFNTLSSGIVTASMQVPYIFIAAFYGENYSAWYGMAMRIVGMPLSLLGQSAGQVYFQKFSHIHSRRHSIYPIIKKLMVKLYSVGTGPMLLIFILVPTAFSLFLGKGWDEAAVLSRILLPWLFVLMVSAPVSRVISVLGIQLKTIFYDISLFVVRIAGLYFCAKAEMSFIVTMAVFSGVGVVFNIFFQFLILHQAKRISFQV